MNFKKISKVILIFLFIVCVGAFYLAISSKQKNSIKSIRNSNTELVNNGTELSSADLNEQNNLYQDTASKDTNPLETLINPQKQVVEKKKVEKNPCPEPKKIYEDQTYLNVDQNTSLEDTSYIPSDLVKLDKSVSTSTLCLKKDAAFALIQMAEAAKKDGYTIKATSGFRDYDTQKSILDRNIKSGNKNATKLVAKPGYSEHQLGVAVDLTSPSISYASATTRFQDTKEAKWLEEHASDYGFIESYPKGKEEITGYLYEAWHYRYVGLVNAQEIIKSEKTTNQFFTGKIAETQR